MDPNFTSSLVLSILMFAPGIVMLASLSFVGLLMLLEKAYGSKAIVTAPVATQEPGPIVAGLKEAVRSEGERDKARVG